MNTLVTGGGGFIGSHLVERLLQDGHRVTVLDKFSKGINLQFQKHHENLKLIKCDISKEKEVRQAYFTDIDWIFHLAAKSNNYQSIQDPLVYQRTNLMGTIYILEAARKSHIKKFLFAASSTCYGKPEVYPTPETAEIKLQNPYALSKYLTELSVLHWGRIYKLPVISLRFFDVYGAKNRRDGSYGPVLSIFMNQKKNGVPFTVVGDGTQSRDFIFVTDVVEAYILAARSDITGEVFNVGSGKAHSIKQIVEFLGGKISYIPRRPGELDYACADISKIKKELNWKPQVTFREGMKKVLENL